MDFNINRMLKQLMDFNIKQNVVFISQIQQDLEIFKG